MGTFSIWHWIVILVIVLVLFGGGKIPRLMGDFAKGIKAFKSGLNDDEAKADPAKADVPAQPRVEAAPADAVKADASKDKSPSA